MATGCIAGNIDTPCGNNAYKINHNIRAKLKQFIDCMCREQ